MEKSKVFEIIEAKQDVFNDVNDKIWEFAELSLMEYKSMELYVKVLKEQGFAVETNIAGVPTAFTGTYGSGKPVIGILAEYDALSGLSQEAGVAERKELVPGGSGHGCGHNALGAGSLAAAIGIKAYLEARGEGSGTVIFYGCPGEEGGAGKAFMAREGVFYALDAALTWHPGDANIVSSGTCNSSIQVEYKFTGVASHAAGSPEHGRSALDAVELMNIGVQFLREHMPDSARVHYAITDAGGNSPNVVQPTAQVLYMVRSKKVKEALALLQRVDNISKGAALMTDTQITRRFIDGTANTVPNKTLEELLQKNLEQAELPVYTAEEKAFADKLKTTYETHHLPGHAEEKTPEIMEYVKAQSNNGAKSLNDFVIPYMYSEKQGMGSTDVGDVSWQTPTAQLGTVVFASGTPGHSWQNVAIGKTSIAHKGILLAGKVLAAAAIDLYENPEIIKAAKAEHAKATEEGYTCPIEKDAVPTAVGGKM
ncbi:MAG: amidohydrolase [Clostridia bacterium]|nr:amidohydrolase [Clostridia bacterium]